MSNWHQQHATGVHVDCSNGGCSGCLSNEPCCCCVWDGLPRASTFNRSSSSRFVSVGSIRYGVRVGAVSPPPPGARYRAAAGLLHQHRHDYDTADEDCCCSVVNLPWPRSVACVSRIPLLVDKQQPPINRCGIFNSVNSVDIPNGSTGCTPPTSAESETAVPELGSELERESTSIFASVFTSAFSTASTTSTRSSATTFASGDSVSICSRPTWSHRPRLGVCLTASDKVQVPSAAQLYLQNQLRRRVLVRSHSDATAYVKLHETGPDTDVALDGAAARRGTLDRLHKFRFGGNRANKDRDVVGAVNSRAKKVGRPDDKVEKLRELTDRLKGASSHKYVVHQPACEGVGGRVFSPVPPPRNKHITHTQTQGHVKPTTPMADHAAGRVHTQPLTQSHAQPHVVAVHQTASLATVATSTTTVTTAVPAAASAEVLVSAPTSSTAASMASSVTPSTSPPLSSSPTQPPPPPPLPSQSTLSSVADTLTFVNLQLPKPEARTVVGSYIQRSIPFRSASFSQVDYSSSDGKYFRKCDTDGNASSASTTTTFTLPRKRENQYKLTEQDTCRVQTRPHDTLKQDIGAETSVITDPGCDMNKLFQMISQNSVDAFSMDMQEHPGSEHAKSNMVDCAVDPNKINCSVLLSGVAVEGTVSERQCGASSNSEEKKRDRSRRRKGMYISQWPDQRASVMLACSQDDETATSGGAVGLPDNLSASIPTLDTKDVQDVLQAFPDDLTYSDESEKKPEWIARAFFSTSSLDEKDSAAGKIPFNKFNYFSRTDSLSEGESDQQERRPTTPSRDHLNSPLLSPSDVSDSESRASLGNDSLSPHMPRRYSKRPLRGPYGQMLEAEMKKPETSRIFSKHHLNNDLKFLDDLSNSTVVQRSSSPNMTTSMISLSSSNFVGHGDQKPKFVMRSRGPSNHSLDDSNLKNNYSGTLVPKPNASSSLTRKTNTDVPLSPLNSSFNDDNGAQPQRLFVCHQRTTSSPSKLEEIAIPNQNERATSAEPSVQLLRELLHGSSEQLTVITASESSAGPGSRSVPGLGACSSTLIHDDTRTHIVVELYETERSYVESLHILVMKYLEPLKSPENSGLLDAALVDEIFYQVPTLLSYHQIFLEELRKRLAHWDTKQKIGDVFLDFTKPNVVETYTAFINNWKRAKDLIKTTSQAKPAFARFLEAMAREHKGKLALDSLLIKPIQKFPKYELLIQRLIKHTDPNHPDYQLLLEAQREVHDNLIKINCTERETLEFEQQQQNLKELEGLVEGLVNLVAADRTYLRHDLVTMTAGQGTRKERALFMFSDLLVVTSIKRRSGTIRKPSGNCAGSVTSTLDANKYKLLMRIPLEDLEVIKTKDENVRRVMLEIENLTEDLVVMNQINDLMWSLHCPHSQLEEVVRDMLSSLNRQLSEQQNSDSQLSYLELTLNTPNGLENLSIIFSQPEKRASWEESLNEAKHKLAMSAERQPSPEFLASVPIRKTRAGLQFTCAAPTLNNTSTSTRDVWVCNSDGYVGQVCVLSLYPEPTVTSCNGVCNARILCVASVPAGATNASVSRVSSRKETHIVDDEEERGSANIQFDSSTSSEEDDDSEREEYLENKSRVAPAERDKSAETASTDSSDDTDNLQPTMWLGTEDGCIHVYNCNDNIRIKKNKIRLQHGSSIQCIIYLDNRVFISLANGDMTIYTREQTGGWNTSSPLTLSVGTAQMPVTRMLPNNGKLWCACSNVIKIFNIYSQNVEHSFQANGDPNKPITCMVVSGLGVWVSLQNSAVIKCFHLISYELLCEVNVAPAVTKMLTSCDDIIRQHKAACLRVTSLLACKELLWIGTSAGVLLTMLLPHITSSTAKISVLPAINGVPHGHTGHVRFLTCIEGICSNPSSDDSTPQYLCRSIPDSSNNSKLLIISGGDGYEDFRNSNMSEVAGREDSTNHLLLWHV